MAGARYLGLQPSRHGLPLVKDVLDLCQAPLALGSVGLQLGVRGRGALQLHLQAIRPCIPGLSFGFLQIDAFQNCGGGGTIVDLNRLWYT